MNPEEVFAFTAEERAELEAGWVDMVVKQEAAAVSAAIEEAVPLLMRAAAVARRPRSRTRKAYDFVARFAGPLFLVTVAGTTGAVIILAFASAW
ncbi:hypothetical protein ACXNSR_19140 [Streptomyces sp. NC-S4]